MASIEKLVKSFEALKVIQTPIDRPEEALVSTRFIKRETSLTKKDKTIHCNTIADIICCPSLRNIEDFHKFLGITIETFLACCDDSDSDIRMIANECLNRTIKNLMDTQLGRIQVELYKEIKKNGSSRSLRAALSRFADLSHLTRPQKCRPYVLNLFPCLVKISERTEEDLIQETLRIAMIKIMPVLAPFATDNEIISVLNAFLPNLQFVMSSVRRTAASSLVVICQYSRKPQIFFSWLLNYLIQSLNKMSAISEFNDNQSEQQTSDRVFVGIFLCLKHMIPHLYEIPSHTEYESLKTFGISQKQRESIAKDYDSITENLLQIYELILHNIRYNNNHNVILSSLEALLQLLKLPPKLILPHIIDSKGIDKSRIGTYIKSSPASPMLSLNRHNRKMQSNSSISCSSINVDSLVDDEEVNIRGLTSLDHKSHQSLNFNASEHSFQRFFEAQNLNKSIEDLNESYTPSEYENYESGLELNRIESETRFASESETQSLKNMNKYSSPNFEVTKLTYVDCEDSANDIQLSPTFTTDSFDAIEERFNTGEIGEYISENIPSLEYCVRLLSNQFLLTGSQGCLIPDKIVRVSVKSLALQCIAAVIRLHPKSLIIELFLENDNLSQKPGESPQKVFDILLFASHSDPQLRGQIAIVIGNFVHEVLKQPISYNEFLLLNCSVSSYSEIPSLEELLNILSNLIFDKHNSTTIKHGLSGLKLCFGSVLESNDSINLIALSLIDQLIELKHNPYWLVKAELVDIFCNLPYKAIHYLEMSSKSSLKSGIFVKTLTIQEKILDEVFFALIADEDFRVREAASVALINLIPCLFSSVLHCDNDPITTIAFEHTINNLPERIKSFNDLDNFVPPMQAFTDPLKFENFNLNSNYLLEANLSNVVKILLNGLQFNLDNKHALIGYCSALSLLSEKYSVTQFSNSWGCDLSDRSIATQLLNIALTLLSANMTVVLDLNTHQSVLTLTANLLEALAFNLIKTNYKNNNISVTELEWGIISSLSPYLATQLDSFFNHLLKILNIYSCIIDESFNTSISSYNKIPVIQTLSNSPLSPIRRKSFKQSSDSVDRNESSKKGDTEKSDRDKTSKLHFSSNSLFQKLFEMLRSSYLSNKTSMDMKGDKISSLLSITLSNFSRLLEISTIKLINKYSEELLHYLKVVFTLEPSLAVKNVRQLLKCIFGTNFTVMFNSESTSETNEITDNETGEIDNSFTNRSSFSNNSTNSNLEFCGLYNCCLSSPYTKFTQLYASLSTRMNSSFGTSDETDLTFTSWLRKKIEKRVSLILDKNISSVNTTINQNTKAALTSHIRLFEPVVIKALKQYTVTSDINLQCEVLDLLSQLVQLRVNYCLLDSEQIFIGFVLKQFEFIESGQFDRYNELIGHIFFFLILLSYERYHSKPIIGIPKIIQLCDGIIASGRHPEKFALPSLLPIVEDLILLRNASKVDSSKELEAQREVIVADCFKLVQFPQILQILLIVTKQSRKDGEEKWKKISRQIIDALLPQLVKQSIHIDSYDSLEILNLLFESVSPSVFRPVDILLKALFAAPQPDITENYYYFHRWTSLILVILRILIVQVKEEVVLARLEELKSSIVTIGPFGLPVIPTSSFSSTNSIPFHMSSITNQNESFAVEAEEMFAAYLLQIIQLCTHEIAIRYNSIYEDIKSHCDFLVKQLANYMLMLTHMFQSGSFRRVAKAAMALIKKSQFQENSDNTMQSDSTKSDNYFSGFSLNNTNSSFMTLLPTFPTLALQWFNLLLLLNYEDNNSNDNLWYKLIRPNHNCLSSSSSRSQSVSKRRGSGNKLKNSLVLSPSYEIIRRCSLILFCDFVCENMNDAEHMTWLIVQNINQIIKMCFELPVSEFISAIHRNSASSGLFIQAINARCDENLKIPSFLRRLLRCLERVHPTQSASLITFLIEKIISNQSLQGNYLLTHYAEDLALNRLNLITSSMDSFPRENTNQISVQDLNKLISSVNTSKYSKLYSKLESFMTDINESNASHNSHTSHPLIDYELESKIPDINKDWFLSILSKYCRKHSKGHRSAFLLNKLSFDDIIIILSSKDFALEILGDCIEFCDQNLIEDDNSYNKIMFSAVLNRINLLKASLNAVSQHVNYFANILPSPHYPFLPHSEMSTPKEARHRHKIIELFSQTNFWNYLFKLSLGFLSFLEHHSERSISPDLLKNTARVAVLYAETAQYMTESVELSSFTQVIVVLQIIKATINCGSLFTYLSAPENISFQCTIISAIHSFAQHFYGELNKLEEPESFVKSEKENPEWKHPHSSCIRLAQLVSFVENNKHDSTHVPSIISSLIKDIILSTARLPLVNSFVMVPISIWSNKYHNTWNPLFSGDFGTVVPTIPSEFLHDREILDQFYFRITRLGWNCRVQFEEIWMSLLGVFGVTSANNDPNEEHSERVNISMTSAKAISQLLLLSTLSPQPGNPIKSKFVKHNNEKLPNFLHTIYGVKLQLVREPLLTAINTLNSSNNETELNSYDFGQISIELLRHAMKTTLNVNELSPSISSASSSSGYSPLSPVKVSKSIQSNQEKLEIDLNSCLHFLLDLYGQLLSSQQQTQLPLLTEICRSTVLLSDLFNERTQFEWLLDTFLELHRMAQISEDEIMSQYLIVGICKSSAVLGLETEPIVDKCKKCIEISLKSPFLPTRIATLHGLKYLLEFRGIGSNGKETLFLPIASDYLLKHLSDNTLPSSHNFEHIEQMWKLSFHLIEHFVEDFSESDFGQKIFNLSLKVLTDKNSKVYNIVVNGLEHLLLCEKFSIKESNLIVKSALDRFKSSNSQIDALLALSLISSATYFVGSVGLDLEKNIDDNEEFLLAMEKLSVIFERLKSCLSFEAQQICNVLPHFLCEFFPTQDILNKCIGEFLSGQRTHAKHLANILFMVFNKLQTESRLDIVHDWVILSLSSFTQLIPLSHAIWSLTSFIISASLNPWIRYTFPYIQTRFGILENSDRELFFIVCYNFYNELKTDQNRESFRSTFQSVAEINSPYSDVLRYLQISKS